jgi:tetratricopeptide (TPR) repeat protein
MARHCHSKFRSLALIAIAYGVLCSPVRAAETEPPNIALARKDCTTGNRRIQPNKVVEACEMLLNWAKATKRNKATALLFIGWTHQNNIKSEKANEFWRLAAAADETYIEPLLPLGLNSTDLDSGLEAFAAAEKLDPKDWRVFSGRAQMYLQFNRSPDALRESERAVALAPMHPEPHRVRGQVLALVQAYDQAIEEYALALRFQISPEPYSPNMMLNEPPALSLARMHHLNGNAASAFETINDYMNALPENRRDFPLFEMRATYLEALGRISEAVDDLDQAALRSPEFFRAKYQSKRDALLLLSRGPAQSPINFEEAMAKGSLNTILRVQVFLRNAGMDFVGITGVYDDATRLGLQKCLADMGCGKKVGSRI